MKNVIHHINKAFENRIRLGIMSILMVNETADFGHIKDTLDITDGNLASHISALEKLEYLIVMKQFIGKKPNTTYKATDQGKEAFHSHLKALENLIRNTI